MPEDATSRPTAKIALPNFPGEEVLAHEGRLWMQSTITALAPHGLVVTAETGVPPILAEIVVPRERAGCQDT